MIKVIQSPSLETYSDYDTTVFLGGGISNCPDWQQEVIQLFKDKCSHDLTIVNPRRVGILDNSDYLEVETQIKWEIDHLNRIYHPIFWFPRETVCPITLFELGKMAQKILMDEEGNYPEEYITVGCHPDYIRKFDLEVQLPAIIPNIKIVYSLEDVVDECISKMFGQ